MSDADGGRSPFGALLRRLRLRAGISQEELAERARVSADGVGALERGTRRAPYRETVDLLAAALGASPSETEDLHAAARRPRRVTGGDGASASSRIHGDLAFEASPLRGRERALADLGALIGHRLVTIVGSGGHREDARRRGALQRTRRAGKGRRRVRRARGARVRKSRGQQRRARSSVRRSALTWRPRQRSHTRCAAAPASSSSTTASTSPPAFVRSSTRCSRSVRASTYHQRRRVPPPSVRGEAVYRLASLDVPPPEAALSAAEALDYGAVALFVARANAAGRNVSPRRRAGAARSRYLPAPRRHRARDRARRSTYRGAVGIEPRGAARRALPVAHRGQPHRDGAAADAERPDRLELRPAGARRARTPRSCGGFRGWVRSSGAARRVR